MKALTICQPWAHAIVHGTKRVENRRWFCYHRGEIVIHAGVSLAYYNCELEQLKDQLDFDPEDKSPWQELYRMDLPERDDMQFGAAIGVASLVDCVSPKGVFAQQECWAEGPHCFVLEDVRALAPIPCRGQQGIWDVPKDVALEIQKQIDEASP